MIVDERLFARIVRGIDIIEQRTGSKPHSVYLGLEEQKMITSIVPNEKMYILGLTVYTTNKESELLFGAYL